MEIVVSRSTPFKIADNIVRFVAINMIDYCFGLRVIVFNPCKGDKAMDIHSLLGSSK